MKLPPRKPGPKAAATIEAEIAIARQLETVARDTGFKFGPRGWAYYLEGLGVIDKSEFSAAEKLIGDLRKSGILDPDIIDPDAERIAEGGEGQIDAETPEEFAQFWTDQLDVIMDNYRPISIWDGLGTYIEVVVEKRDLKQIMQPVCDPFGIMISNLRGDTSIEARRQMLIRMRDHYRAGRRPVVLHWGDHDPKGLKISRTLRKNLLDCVGCQGVDWDGEPIEVIRAGLNRQQIDDLGLMWIDNLVTGSGQNLANPKHKDHGTEYVQSYIADHGPRKVEANALIGNVDAAQAILRDLITDLIPADWPDRHDARLAPHRLAARSALMTIGGPT